MIVFLKNPLFALFLFAPLAVAQTTIDLSKPVSQSLKPDILYWPMDGGTLDVPVPLEVDDASGNGFTGLLQAGKIHPAPVYDLGKFDTALKFHGLTPPVQNIDGQERNLNPSPSVVWMIRDTPGFSNANKFELAGKSFTAGLWIRIEKISPKYQSVLLMNWGTSPESQWSLNLVKNARDQWDMRVLRTKSVETDVINDGNWHHLAFSIEEKEGGIAVNYWLDGVRLGAQVTTPTALVESFISADQIFRVGERNVANFSTGFAGMIDDVFVTSGVLSFHP